jgi:hypothetical protein
VVLHNAPLDTLETVSAYWYDALGRRVIASNSNTNESGKVRVTFYEAAAECGNRGLR